MIGFVTTLKPEDVAYVPLKKKPDDAVSRERAGIVPCSIT